VLTRLNLSFLFWFLFAPTHCFDFGMGSLRFLNELGTYLNLKEGKLASTFARTKWCNITHLPGIDAVCHRQ
jgi:hypothetical protein